MHPSSSITTHDKAREANAPHRVDIIAAKRKLRAQIHDMPARFAAATIQLEQQIAQIEHEVKEGTHPVPQIEFAHLDRIPDAQKARIHQRGCVVIRNVFEDERVQAWNTDLAQYLERNNYLQKRKANATVDNYFNTLASDKPQIYGVFWSQAQMQARTSVEMTQAQRFLNHLWKFEGAQGRIFEPDRTLVYADRVRFREPGDASLGLSLHCDSGSIERWIDPAYQIVYRHVYGGDLAQYDPFDALGRTDTTEIASPAVCRVFRTFQAWTALSAQGPGDGTLQLLPIANAMAWVLLRALQDDVAEDELCGAAACRAMMLDRQYHSMLYRACVSIPHLKPGDTVWWHPDLYHGVEDIHTGADYSSVMYIAPVPDCAKNRRYALAQQKAFELGHSAPDFAQDNLETDFVGRFTKADLTPEGLKAMAYD